MSLPALWRKAAETDTAAVIGKNAIDAMLSVACGTVCARRNRFDKPDSPEARGVLWECRGCPTGSVVANCARGLGIGRVRSFLGARELTELSCDN